MELGLDLAQKDLHGPDLTQGFQPLYMKGKIYQHAMAMKKEFSGPVWT